MKHPLLTFVLFLTITSISIYLLGYRGERHFDTGDTLPSPERLVASAKKLRGTPYDPLMGMYSNVGAKLGFIVCSDVPNIAYGLAGFSWKKALSRDFLRTPSAYQSSNGNNPGNPYFHRRARNLYAWFRSQGKLMPNSYKPSIGDLVFYRKQEKGYISHVALVMKVDSDGYTLMESAPKTLIAQEVSGDSPIERGWILSGYGKVY